MARKPGSQRADAAYDEANYPNARRTGKTQAQLDAEEGQRLAKISRDNAPTPAEVQAARDRAAIAAEKAAKAMEAGTATNADTAAVAAEQARMAAQYAAVKAAQDKYKQDQEGKAADAAKKAEQDRINAEWQKKIDDLKADAAAATTAAEKAAALAEAKRLEDVAAAAATYAAQNASLQAQITAQGVSSKYAYDMAAAEKANDIKIERTSAYQLLKSEFAKYGLDSLVDSVEALIMNGTPKAEATLKLRATEQYKLRFAGNTQRLAQGKNLYDESTYLALENDFQTSFAAYGQKALLGNTRESAQAMFADFIGGDIAPTEVKDRLKLAVDEVASRKDIRDEFKKYFPEINDSDLVAYFLKPKETLSKLVSKVKVSQIGAAASRQGLSADLATAQDFEQLGITEDQAKVGYQRVATDLSAINKLGSIDKIDIGQKTAENAYIKGLASEQRKIDQAAERERNRFLSTSGITRGSLSGPKII